MSVLRYRYWIKGGIERVVWRVVRYEGRDKIYIASYRSEAEAIKRDQEENGEPTSPERKIYSPVGIRQLSRNLRRPFQVRVKDASGNRRYIGYAATRWEGIQMQKRWYRDNPDT